MFGYILPLKTELKVKEFEYFKCYYHGLCYAIKDNFGNFPRLTLNYDMTFIGFLLDGLSNNNIEIKAKRCIKHPTYDILVVSKTSALDYVSNLTIVFTLYKLKDNINDDKSVKSKFLHFFLNKSSKNLFNEYEYINKEIENSINKLNSLEINRDFNTYDEVCEPFSHCMGYILSKYPYELYNDSNELREKLYRLGYSIGRYIYLMDAIDDFTEDMENNKFNPLKVIYNYENSDYNSFIKDILIDLEFNILSSISNCMEIIQELDFQKHREIIENIISLGMTNRFYLVLNKYLN